MDERSVSHDQPFLARIYKEDVGPCLNFPNKEVGFLLKKLKLINSIIHLIILVIKQLKLHFRCAVV